MADGTELTLDVVKAAFWPLLALIALLAFYSPIYTLLDGLAARSGNIETLKLGTLELHIERSELPTPTSETARVLPHFDRKMVLTLLVTNGESGPCFQGKLSEDKTIHPMWPCSGSVRSR